MIKFEIMLTGYEPDDSHYPKPQYAANCIGCGRFCKSTSHSYYDGTWNQLEITYWCKNCDPELTGTMSEKCV